MSRPRRSVAGLAGSVLAAGVAAGAVALLLLGGGTAAAQLPLTFERPSDGRPVELTAGAPALHVVFFATWCPECVDELDRLADLEARWNGRGYRLVLVAVPTRHTAERLRKFAQDRMPPGEL